MPEIHLPFQHGQHEGIDPKLLPQGVFSALSNVRYRKDGRLGSRYGLATVSGAPSDVVAGGTFAQSHSVYITDRTSEAFAAKWTDYRDDGSFSTAISGSAIGTLGVPERTAVARNLKYQCAASDCAVAGSYIFYVYHDVDLSQVTANSNGVTMLVYEPTSGRLITRISVSSSGTNPRILAMGSTIAVFVNEALALKGYFYNSSTFSVTSATVVTQQAATGWFFDVAPNDSSSCLVVYNKSGVLMEWGTCNTSGTFTAKATQAIANPVRTSITLKPDGNVAIAWAEGINQLQGNCYFGTWTLAGAVVTGKTTADSSGNVNGFPVIGPCITGTSTDYILAWNFVPIGAPGNEPGMKIAGADSRTIYGLHVASRPFTGYASGCYIWTVDNVRYLDGLVGGQATYKLLSADNVGLDLSSTTNQVAICEAVCCQLDALAANRQTFSTSSTYQFVDPRRSTVSVTALSRAPSSTAHITCLPVDSFRGFGADAVRMENGPWADRLLTAKLNGQLFFSGPRLREFDGSYLYESGLGQGPKDARTTGSGIGALNGSYLTVTTYEWVDSLGNRHQSPPSEPFSFGVTNKASFDHSVERPSFSSRLGGNDNIVGIYANFWRTTADGNIFYLVNKSQTVPTLPHTGTAYLTFSEAFTDAQLADGTHEILYTQGDRGGLSGILPHDEPPPCKYICAGNDRLLLGGLEQRNEVQWSKLVYPGEPVQFSIEAFYRARVEGDVTAVATHEGVWYIGTRDAIWAVSGDGPDDNGQGGQFSSPVRLPSEVGILSHRSVVEVPGGLLFQATTDRIYMLPSGGGPPQWVGQPIRDTLASYPFVVSAVLSPGDNTVRFTCIKSDASAAIVLVYDTRIGEWSVDTETVVTSPHMSTLHGGKLILDAAVLESSSYADASSTVIVQTITTGDVRPFGPLGRGRARSVHLMGEFRSDCQVEIEVSYDSGQTWDSDDSGTWTFGTGGQAQTAGDTVSFRFLIPHPRGETFRVRVTIAPTTAGEGFVLNDMSFEVFPEQGVKRPAAAYAR